MAKLLQADWYRLMRATRSFWLLTALSLGCSLIIYLFTVPGTSLGDASFSAAPVFIGCLCVLLCASYDGAELADGTRRNKLIPSGERAKAYASSLLVGLAGCLALLLVFYAPYFIGLANGHYVLGPEGNAGLRSGLANGALFTAFLSVAFHVFGSLGRTQLSVLVAAAILFLGLVISCGMLSSALREPEYWPGEEAFEMAMEADGLEAETADLEEAERNPSYVGPEARPIYEAWLTALPGTAATGGALEGMDEKVCWTCWLLECVALAGAGMLAFSRHDLT